MGWDDDYSYKKSGALESYDVNRNGYDRDGVHRGRDDDMFNNYQYNNSNNNNKTNQSSSDGSKRNNAASGSGLLVLAGLIAAGIIFDKYYDYVVSIGGIIAVALISSFIIYEASERWDIIRFIILAAIGAVVSVLYFTPQEIFSFFENNWSVILTVTIISILCLITCLILRIKLKKAGLFIFLSILFFSGLIAGTIYTGHENIGIHYMKIGMFYDNIMQKTPVLQRIHLVLQNKIVVIILLLPPILLIIFTAAKKMRKASPVQSFFIYLGKDSKGRAVFENKDSNGNSSMYKRLENGMLEMNISNFEAEKGNACYMPPENLRRNLVALEKGLVQAKDENGEFERLADGLVRYKDKDGNYVDNPDTY